MTTVIQQLASLIEARENCQRSGNTEWEGRHEEAIKAIAREYLPSGSGWDVGTTVDLDRSTPDRIVLDGAYHHMNDGGMYDGWTAHDVVVTPSLAHGFSLRITGKDRNGIKDYLGDLFQAILSAEYTPLDYGRGQAIRGEAAR